MGDAPAFCVATCPLHIDVRGYIDLINEGEYKQSIALIREKTPFPGILGRVCAHPCEENCKRQDVENAMSIKNLKRFAADFDDPADWDVETKEITGKEVAIIGSGPAGALAAYDLQKMGHQVTIFEALPVVGGMLRVGIPAYRLPGDVIDNEYKILEDLGVEIRLNTRVGEDIPYDELEEDYDAVFIAAGAHKSIMLPVEGSDLKGVVPGVEFLREVGLTGKPKTGNKVVVVGGGNVAMDVARTVWRLGAEEINVICLESRDEMPAHTWEIEDAEEEGIKVNCGWGPLQFNGKDRVESITVKKCISVFDEEGNFNPSYDEDQTREIEADMIIIAIGQQGDIPFLESKKGIELSRGNKVKVDEMTLQTDKENVFAGGDIAGRPLLAIEAMAHGRKAAVSIDRYLKGEDLYLNREKEGTYETWLEKDIDPEEVSKKRVEMNMLPVEERKGNFSEVELGFNEEEARSEAERCLQCECKLCMQECEMLNDFCVYPKELFQRFLDGEEIDPLIPYSCNMCSQCTIVCPEEYKMKELFMDIRKQMIKDNNGKSPIKGHGAIEIHQLLGFSWLFNTARPARNPASTSKEESQDV
ncbi:MAG: oxidoreductase [Firmicutes bacterium]|nr:oxidoreductase [Bacillota bacterium]